jgi:hypothetical protein
MVAIRLTAVVGEDRRLVIDLPEDAPTGPVQLVIRPKPVEPTGKSVNPAREAARAKLLAAGALVTHFEVPEDAVPLTPEERMRIGTMPPGTRGSEELIDEDRGEW